MSRANLLVAASLLALFTTGCGRNGGAAAMVGLGILSAAAQVANAVVTAEQERAVAEQAVRDRARHDAAMARYEAAMAEYEARHRATTTAPGLPPGTVIIVEPPPPAE